MMNDSGFWQRVAHPSLDWGKALVLLVLAGSWPCIIFGEVYDSEAPHFLQEPNRLNYFINTEGLALHCKAKGRPVPQVQWINHNDDQPLQSYPGVREVFSNGTIHIPPFPSSFFRDRNSIFGNKIACIATNSVGRIRSPEVYVKAVIHQKFEIRVDDAVTTEGNDAVFKCIIPDAQKDFVSVTSWTKDGNLNIFPHSGGGRYFMTPSGELLIEEVTRNDTASTFRCRTVNRLTGETQLSENSARLQLSGGPSSKSKSESPPNIWPRASKLRLKEGEVAVLLCLSEGWPPPSQWWLRSSGIFGGLEALRATERIRVRRSVVIIENVGVQDSGTYVCVANNSMGQKQHEISVIVKRPLSVQVVPPVLTADIGKSAEFSCWTNSPDETSQSTERQISWRKDGIEIRSNSRLSLSMSGDKLRIASVKREDKGIYQCFVHDFSDVAQGSSELRLGDAVPQFSYRFIEQTLRPGPSVSLKCSAGAGNPTPKISWNLDGFSLPHSERILIGQYVTVNGDVVSHVNITSTKVEDGGEWTCTAESSAGKVSHSARLNVYGPPVIRNMPASLTAVAGKDFKVKCPVAGFPIQSITWEKDGQALPMTRRQLVSVDGSLTVKDVDRSVDAGYYACMASNKQGQTDRKGVQLNVVVSPKIVPFSFPSAAKQGEKVFATCVVSEGDPPIRLQWVKNSEVIGDTARTDLVKGEHLLDLSTHRIGESDALVLQITNVQSHHSANYSCRAQNEAGFSAYTAQLVVHVPPKIAPFSFPPHVAQGTRVSAVCSLETTIDDTNFTVNWLKDSVPLVGSSRVPISIPSSGQGSQPSFVKVVHVDAYSAMLMIDRVESAHSGNYTCEIHSSIEKVASTATLVVHVPPRFVIEPREVMEVLEGSTVVVPCQAEGFPAPSILWKKATGNRPENYRDIPVQSASSNSLGFGSVTLQHQPGGSLSVISSSSEDTFSLPNGTLIIRGAKLGARYLCEASNGLAEISKFFRLVVNVPVHIKEQRQNVSSRVGGKATLKCEISGDPPILEIIWKKGSEEILPNSNFRYSLRTVNNSQGILSELTINNVVREDTSKYFCSAANLHGRSQGAVWLYVQEPPHGPRNLHAISKGSRFVRLGWLLTQDGNSPVIQFIVRYKMETGGGTEYSEITVPGQVFSETVGNLRPSKKYLFTVIAENQVGQSEQSETLEIKTDGEAPEGRPRNVRVAAVSSTDIQVTWDHPERETWHGELLGYYVGYRRLRDGPEQYHFSTVEKRDGLQEFQIRELRAFTSYEIVVQTYNGFGPGPLADPVVATTLEDVPSTGPDGLHCSALTSDSIQLGWNLLPPENSRGLVRGYKVFIERTDFDVSSETSEAPLVRTTPSPNLVVSGLGKYKNYSIQVLAFTVAGEGPLSPLSPVYCSTEEDLPESPSAIKTVASSPSSIIVTWLPPANANGVLIKYMVYINSQEAGKGKDGIKRKRPVLPNVTKFQFDGLKEEEKYEVKVAAFTKVGEGSHASSYHVLGKYEDVAIISFGQEYRIVWKTDVRLPCETVGSPGVQWTRYGESIRESDRISATQDGALLIRNARREDSGNYSCEISDKKSHVLESIMHKVVVQVPPSIPLLSAAVNSHSSLNVQWKLSDAGNAPVRGYILHLKADDEWNERQISRHLTSYELRSLECGTPYQMYLTAFNRAGMGRASEVVNVSTLGHPPSLSLLAPQFMVETNSTWARVLLRDVWAENGCPIRKFRVSYKETGSFQWQSVGPELVGESQSTDLVGLKGGTSYVVRVVATNSAGSSQAEVTINTPMIHGAESERSEISNPSESVPLYLDLRLVIPMIASLVSILMVVGGVCICLRKKAPISYRSTDHLSTGTSSSSTYFKQNQRNSQPQVYMTVKKSTPLKGVDVTDLGPIPPEYVDDIYPYATFELNENRRESKTLTAIPTLERRRTSGQSNQWNQNSIYHEPSSRLNMKPKGLHSSVKQEESEEYDTYGSDTDTEIDPRPGANRSSIHSRLNSKYQDSHARHGNRYEFAPPTSAMLKTRQMQNEIHGMVMADPYSFNDAFPTVDEKKGRKSKRKRSKDQTHQPAYQTVYEASELGSLDPPLEFKDANYESVLKGTNRRSNSSTDYAIAV